MDTPYLLNAELIRTYEDLSTNIKPGRLNIFIRKAQELDIKPFLGYVLYNQLLGNFSNDNQLKEDAPEAYRDLYSGCTYINRAGHTISYRGLTPALVYFTFARFIEADSIHYTAAGPVIKQQDQAISLQPADLSKLVQQQRSVANAYLRDVEKFLQDNTHQFPSWRFNEKNASARQPGPRIRGIDRTHFNYPDGRGEAQGPFPINQFL